MERAILLFKVVLILSLTAWAGQASQRDQYVPKQIDLNESDLDRLEKELADPTKRLAAIASLTDFGGGKLYQVGSVFVIDSDATRNALRERAAKLARLYTDIDTVSHALDSEDPRLQLWGLWFWSAGISKVLQSAGRNPMVLPVEGLTDEEKEWRGLMLKIQRLAKESPHRSLAIDNLTSFSWSENHEFLRGLIPIETSASIVLRLLERTERRQVGTQSKRDERFNDELLRLLAHPDVEVRRAALADIAMNWNNAEMWQVRFSVKISQRVEILQRSDDAEEKRLANWAAEGLEKIARIWLERDGNKIR